MRLFLLFGLLFGFAATAWGQRTPGFDITSLDRSVDPCVDFYKFSCGGWMAANPLPGDQSRYGTFDALREHNRAILQNILESVSANKASRTVLEAKIGDFYYACMNEKSINGRGTSPLKPLLDRITALKDKKELTDLVIQMFKSGATPFFSFSSEQDARDSTQVIGGLDQPALGMPDRDYYLMTDNKSVELRAKYVAHVTKMFTLLGSKPAAAQKQTQAVMAIETGLAKGSFDRVTRRDPEKVYHKLPVSELTSLAPDFEWTKFFKGIGAPPIESLDVSVPPAVRAFEELMLTSSLEDIKSYFTWTLLHASVPGLPSAFVEEDFNFYGKALSGQKEMRARWKRCVDLTDESLPDALGKTFVEKTLGEDGMRRTKEMVAEIEKALERDIQSLDWMTAKTKEQAVIKLHAIMNKIGTKDKWLDYASVKVTRDDFFGDSVRTGEFALARALGKIGKPVDKTDWSMSQPTVNAYYDPAENNVNFPAGILQPPFWNNAADDAVNYGAIGMVIGHELTHGFDDQGRQYDANGNLRDWWTEEDAKAFEKRTDCLTREYGEFSPVEGVTLNGKLTLGENTADNGGVRIAYMAFMDSLAGKVPAPVDGFTAEQRFFLGMAQIWCQNTAPEEARRRALLDPHSSGPFRVNGVVSNLAEFRQAYGCKEGQPMVRAQSCKVW